MVMRIQGINVDRFRSVESLLPIFELLDQSHKISAKEEALKILSTICTDIECRNAIR